MTGGAMSPGHGPCWPITASAQCRGMGQGSAGGPGREPPRSRQQGGSPPCTEKARGAIRGGLVIVGGMPESPWFDPFETAAAELGTPYSVGEIYAFEAFRTGLTQPGCPSP